MHLIIDNSVPLNGQQRPRSESMEAQADLGLFVMPKKSQSGSKASLIRVFAVRYHHSIVYDFVSGHDWS